jgi:drug/metabolite transporter (DMT)-like permease
VTVAIVGGLGAALAWAGATIFSTHASRLADPRSVVAGVMLAGLAMTAPWCAVVGVPHALWGSSGAWLLLAGAGNVAGLLAVYTAYRVGQVSLIAPITSTEGAIAAVIAVLAGEHLATGVGIALAAIAIGICLAARGPGAAREPRRPGILLAGFAALAFGVGLYAAGRVSSQLPLAWLALAARLVGTVVVAAPLALSGRLRISRPAAPFVLGVATCEVTGFTVFSIGARHSVAVASVLASQFAAIAAYFAFGERLARTQLAGVAIVIAGVSAVSALSA